MPPRTRAGARDELGRRTNRVIRRAKIPGLSLGVLHHGRRVVARGYGYRDLARRLPATTRTIYGIASMTKSFTALAILRLQEEGRLRVTDPVVRHLPEFRTPEPRRTRAITLHHFLSHSSGLPPLPSIYYTSGRSIARDPPYDPKVARRVGIDPDHPPIDTYEGILDYLATERYRLLGPPGAQFSYSNEGFGLLGAVIERASGRTYERFVEDEILRPAGMQSSTFDTGVMLRSPEVTTLYSPHWREPRRKGWSASQEWWEDTCLRAAGALRTNVEDLFRYLEIYLRNGRVGRERIVSPESLAAMLQPVIEVSPGLFYGYGLVVRPDYYGHRLAYHGGGLKGVSSLFAVLPEAGLGGAVLANADMVPSDLVLEAAVNQRLGLPLPTPFVPVPRRSPPVPTGRALTEYAGWYCSGEGIWMKVRARPRGLVADFHGIEFTEKGLRLRPIGADGFLVRRGQEVGRVAFVRRPDGRLWAAQLGWRLVRRRDPAELPRARHGRMVW
jgi:CubicO group peptidase (beta-lactamase class C family)